MRDQLQHNRDKHRRRDRGVYHREIQEPEPTDRRRADQVHLLASDAIGDVPRQRYTDERNASRNEDRAQDQIAAYAECPRHRRR